MELGRVVVTSSDSDAEGRAEVRLPVIHSPAMADMVIYDRGQAGSIKTATAPAGADNLVRPGSGRRPVQNDLVPPTNTGRVISLKVTA
jgi:hypothetical protein